MRNMRLLEWMKKRWADAHPKPPQVEITRQEIICRYSDGIVYSIRWDDLRAIIIETNDLGPFGEDWYWLLFGKIKSQAFSIPQCAIGEQELLINFQTRLAAFDNEAVIRASSSINNKSFLCWEYSGDWYGHDWAGIVLARNYRNL